MAERGDGAAPYWATQRLIYWALGPARYLVRARVRDTGRDPDELSLVEAVDAAYLTLVDYAARGVDLTKLLRGLHDVLDEDRTREQWGTDTVTQRALADWEHMVPPARPPSPSGDGGGE